MANYSTGRENNNWRGGPGKGTCRYCGTVFYAPVHKLKERIFCSHECYEKNRIIPNRHITRPHVLVVEKILGRRLPATAVVHHVDRNRKNQSPDNLVVCQNQAYHLHSHSRMRILEAGGNPNFDKICSRCKTPKPLGDFHYRRDPDCNDGRRYYCKPCQSKRAKERRKNNGTSCIASC